MQLWIVFYKEIEVDEMNVLGVYDDTETVLEAQERFKKFVEAKYNIENADDYFEVWAETVTVNDTKF